MASVTVASPDSGQLDEVSFRPATGGLISETRRKSKNGDFGSDYKRETAVHSNIGQAVRHLKSVMGSGVEKKAGKHLGSGVKNGKSTSMRKH